MEFETVLTELEPSIRWYTYRTHWVHGSNEDATQEAKMVLWKAYSMYKEYPDDELLKQSAASLTNNMKDVFRKHYTQSRKGFVVSLSAGRDHLSNVDNSDGGPLYTRIKDESLPEIDEEYYKEEVLLKAGEIAGGLGERIVNELLYGEALHVEAVRRVAKRKERPGTPVISTTVVAKVFHTSITSIQRAMARLELACKELTSPIQ